MRKFFVLSLAFVCFMSDGFAATARGVRSTNTRGGGDTSAAAATNTTAARSARSARSATVAKPGVAARSARSATVAKPGVAARAAVTQKVIGTGTKVAAAEKNIVVSEDCQLKYEGCMDSFCMLDNETGGRCICSNRNIELDAVLAEIEALDQQSYQMATFGVEKIEMGTDADAAIASANAAAKEVIDGKDGKQARRSLDLSQWDMSIELEDEIDVFGSGAMSPLQDKKGDALHRAAAEICVAQIPECASDIAMLQMMYAQRIKSDCAAYENSLKQQKNASQQKLVAAERAMREAALEQLRTANKYDLGQCTIEFKKCMQTTAGCGSDFSSCATVMAIDNTTAGAKKAKNYKIKGAVADISISASTYDTLIAKKPLCESVTKSCVNVADQVWDTFLKEVAPQVKNAELIAEDNARQNCIGNISSCFQKACKDNIDPNDPDGSYDMCLTRPETMLNVCKVPLNACGIDASNHAAAAKSDIWDFVVARLASMRVDACTNDVKNCLQSDDRCGKDYANCIGLDLQALEDMCPLEKLVSCQKQVEEDGTVGYAATWDDIANIVQGIWLGIDNAMLEQCQNIASEKMIEVCGDVATCNVFEDDSAIGTESLISYSNPNGDVVIEGLISFGHVTVARPESKDDDIKFGMYEVDIGDYKSHLEDEDPAAVRVVSALQSASNKINRQIALLTQDPKVKMCIEGRDMSQIRGKEGDRADARYPYLLDSYILTIIAAGLDQANKNYEKKYNELLGAALEAKDDAVKSVLCASMAASSQPECKAYTTVDGMSICTDYQPSSFDNIFTDSGETGLVSEDIYLTKYVVSGAKLSDIAKQQQKGRSEFNQTDGMGNMVGKVSMSSMYSASDNTCTITTTTALCKTMKEIITKHTSKSCGSIALDIIGGGCGGGFLSLGLKKRKTVTSEVFEGVACTEFMEPTTTTTTVKM